MKSVAELLEVLHRSDIKLWVEGGHLHISAPRNTMTQAWRQELAERKEEILAFLSEAQMASQEFSAPILPVPQSRDLPLSFSQQRLWFINQLEGDARIAYNEPILLSIHGPLNIAILEQSLKAIIQRHDVLRTTFPIVENTPVQRIAPVLAIPLSRSDLTAFSEKDRMTKMEQLAVQQIRQLFDLQQGPLLRMTLFTLGMAEYALLITMHHIIIDEWSIRIFLRELSCLYSAFLTAQHSPLQPLGIQYADFAYWQRQRLQGAFFEKHLAYWQQQLAGIPPITPLPEDRPRPLIQTFRGKTAYFQVSAELTQRLKSLSQQSEVTLFMTLFTAFVTLLARYNGQEELVLGTPFAHRHYEEIEPLIGFFTNTLVLRITLADNPPFIELLKRVRQVIFETYEHQEFPFEKLVEALHPQRNPSYTPLFQVMFVFQNTPLIELELPELTVQPIDIDTGTAKFDVTLLLTKSEEGLTGKIEYNIDLFDSTTMTQMADHFQTLLEDIVNVPQQRIGGLKILTEDERQQLLTAWQGAQCNFPKDRCIHEVFEARAHDKPEAVAVVCKGEQLSYQALNRRANQLAHYLRKLGVGPGIPVGIWMERSLDMIVGILGIIKAGGAYVPMDIAYPPERITFMLEDCQTPILLTQHHLVEEPLKSGKRVVCPDTDWDIIGQESPENPLNETRPDDLLYVIYTSGSTGKPKGVLITHHNVMRLFQANQAWFRFHAQDVWTFFHSYAFDFSVWELWGALLYGGRLVVVPYHVSRTPEAFYELLCREHVTVLNQTPSAFRQLMRVEDLPTKQDTLPLRLVILGGEALELSSLKPWFERHDDTDPQIVNMYGITETTVHVTYRPITMADVTNASGSLIGKPIPDLQIYILDQYLQPVPIGIPGEIFVGGAGVARGYLHRDTLTSEKFILNPFSNVPEDRLYRTGDMARYLHNGDIEYLGRIDDQVKIRGFRIEPGEIESALTQHPAIEDVVVIAREDSPDQKQMVAYIVEGKNVQEKVKTTGLREHLKATLPEHMIPSVFVTLDALPLTPNGKIDRRALPAPKGSRPHLDAVYVGPQSEIERIIAQVWQDILRVDQVGIHDNFFELGGHSLLAAQIQSTLQEKFEQKISLIDIFQYPTVSLLANYIQSQHDPEQMASSAGHARANRRRIHKASMKRSAQLRQQRRREKQEGGSSDE